ncbi:hypothetical protein [Enterococcus sp. AZ103]|uniref:hypothetical protein n=1 Tax=Enterococcus sp. AZ103 TaxID=2774628 RepID=UPI003F2340A1
MNNSFLLKSHIENRTGVKQSGYFSFQFDLPFQLPLFDKVQLGTISERKILMSRNNHVETNKGKRYFSTIEVVTMLISPNKISISNEYLKENFSKSIEYLNYCITCFIRVLGPEYSELREITKQDIPKKIQYFYINSRSIREDRIVTDWFNFKYRDSGEVNEKPLIGAQVREVANYVENAHEDPFFNILKYLDRANYAQRNGYYQEAIIHLGTFMEMFLYKITQMLMTNKKKPNAKISNIMNSSNFGNILDTQFSSIFNEYGVVYDRRKAGNNLYEYWDIVYQLRCAVVHEGKHVNQEDTLKAFRISLRFVVDIVRNLQENYFDKKIYDFSKFIKYSPKSILDYEL